MAGRSGNPKSSSESILKCIKDYDPVTSIEIAKELKITTQRVQSAVGFLITKKKVNIQKKGNLRRKELLEYFFDKEFPIIGAPSLTEQTEEKEADALFDELVEGEEQIAPMKPKRSPKGIDALVDRCHHLIKALEFCSSCTIMDSFNLDEEQARVLVNKVAAKYSDINVSFSVTLKKEK